MTERIRQITVRLRSPLLLGNESGADNYEQTADYIPGSVLRGAVAARLLDALPDDYAFRRDHASCPEDKTPPFWRVFGAPNPPRFGNAYPSRPGLWAYPFPVTARTCKRHPGYRSEENRDGHGVVDTMVEQSVYDMVSDPWFPYRADIFPELGNSWAKIGSAYEPRCQYREPRNDPERRERCREPLEPAKGHYSLGSAGPGPVSDPTISRATHVGINRARGVAEDSLLFTLETIDEPGAEFHGILVYDDTYASDLTIALSLDGKADEFVIGRGRSRGMGLVEISVDAPPSLPGLGERLYELNRDFESTLARYQVARPAGWFFSLTLRSSAILTAQGELPTLWPDLSTIGLEEAWPLRAWARTTVVGGWDSAAELPRRTRQAVEPGAVYLYYVSEETMGETALTEQLVSLERAGVGAQRERGYGQLTACAPFHYADWKE
jgi:CRISPR-associated protein Csx10